MRRDILRKKCKWIHPHGSECGTCPCEGSKDCYITKEGLNRDEELALREHEGPAIKLPNTIDENF